MTDTVHQDMGNIAELVQRFHEEWEHYNSNDLKAAEGIYQS